MMMFTVMSLMPVVYIVCSVVDCCFLGTPEILFRYQCICILDSLAMAT